MDRFDLLIVYEDGVEKIIQNVDGYEHRPDKGVFVFRKNGYNNFVVASKVFYFGRADAYDYEFLPK